MTQRLLPFPVNVSVIQINTSSFLFKFSMHALVLRHKSYQNKLKLRFIFTGAGPYCTEVFWIINNPLYSISNWWWQCMLKLSLLLLSFECFPWSSKEKCKVVRIKVLQRTKFFVRLIELHLFIRAVY